MQFIAVLEGALGKRAHKKFVGMQPGDVEATYADFANTRRDLGFEPRTSITEGLPRIVSWHKQYHGN